MKWQVAGIVACGMVSGPAVAEMACHEVQLNANQNQVRTKGPVFEIRNGGKGSIRVVTNDDSELAVLEAGGKTMLFGDNNYNYFVKLADPKESATIMLCE